MPGGDVGLVVPDGAGGWLPAPESEYARLEVTVDAYNVLNLTGAGGSRA
jgi:hypothetical protein